MDSPATEGTTANRQIARAAGTVMFAIIAGQVFSLLSSMLITRAFGTGIENEAFFAANRLPDILYNLVAGGALASAFIPTFTGLLAKGQREKAWLMASSIANLITAIIVFVGALAAIFAPWVVHNILAPGFTDPVKFQLTVNLVRIQLAAPVIFGLSGLTMGILNSHQSFLWPALAPAMYSIGKILGVALLVPSMGVYGLALGVVGGALMHGLIQLPSLLRLPMRKYTPTFGLRIPDVREVARLMGPRLLGVAFVQLNFLVNYRLASSQPLGSVTAITVAFSLMMIPEAAIAQAIAIAALPTFSAQVAKGELGEMRSSLAALLRAILLLAVPASLGLVLLARPIVAFIFERGAFDPHSTELVTWALIWYAAGLVGHSVVEIVSRAFYALHDTKTPVFVGVAAMSLNVILSILFSRMFITVGWMPHGGLALANSLATFLESFALLFFMCRRLSGLEGRNVLTGAWKALLAGGFMSAALWAWVWLTGRAGNWLITLGGMAVGILSYTMGLLVLRTPELTRVAGFVRRKFNPYPQRSGTVTLVITPARPEVFPAAARLLADTMAGFGVAVLGAGDEALELRALAQWFTEKGNRFSYQFAHIARLEGEVAGLLLCFPGREAERLSLACRHSILNLYGVRNLAKLIWRGMVIGHNREAKKDEFLVAHIAVFEQFRRKGIATALLEKAAVLAEAESFSRVALEVEIGNTAAIECYQRFGFITQFTTNFGRHAGILQCPGYHKMLLHL